MNALRSIARALRPAEWVVLAFVMYVGIRAARAYAGTGELDAGAGEPRVDIVCAALTVIAIQAALRYRALPWPPGSTFVKPHWILLPFTLAPGLLQLLALANPAAWNSNALGSVGAVHGVFAALWIFRRLAFAGLPLLLCWLALGSHLKRHGRLQPLVLGRESIGGALAATRDWAPPLLMLLAYGSLGAALDFDRRPDVDAQLFAFDRAIFFGHSPVHALQAITTPWLSDWMAFCYSFYALLYAVGLGAAYGQSREGFWTLALAVTATLAIGYTSFSFFPAQGPAFTQHFNVSLDDYYLQWVKDELMDKYRVPRDCFPSLHTAVSMVFLLHARRTQRKLFWVLLPIVGTIPISCVYLRYHYVTDVLAGLALAFTIDWAAPRIQRAWLQPAAQPAPAIAPN